MRNTYRSKSRVRIRSPRSPTRRSVGPRCPNHRNPPTRPRRRSTAPTHHLATSAYSHMLNRVARSVAACVPSAAGGLIFGRRVADAPQRCRRSDAGRYNSAHACSASATTSKRSHGLVPTLQNSDRKSDKSPFGRPSPDLQAAPRSRTTDTTGPNGRLCGPRWATAHQISPTTPAAHQVDHVVRAAAVARPAPVPRRRWPRRSASPGLL